MVKKYGGYTGNPSASDPSSSAATGSWQAPSEIARQRGLGEWPKVSFPSVYIFNNIGEYTYAAASGAAFESLPSGYLIPSGQAVSRTTYSDLFDSIGENYGAGDGLTTFNLPNLQKPYIHLKPFPYEASLTITNASGTGRLPYHTHTFSQPNSWSGGGASPGSPGGYGAGNFGSSSKLQGTKEGNRGATMEMVPLIATADVRSPVGLIAPLLIPDVAEVAAALPPNTIICSGQELSRTTYSHLYTLVGNLFGQGDGSTTFNAPDLRGLFISAPYYDIQVPSGHSAGPSGFLPNNIASHIHGYTSASFYYTGQRSGGPTGATSSQNPPDSSLSSIGANEESRPDNITCVYVLVVE